MITGELRLRVDRIWETMRYRCLRLLLQADAISLESCFASVKP